MRRLVTRALLPVALLVMVVSAAGCGEVGEVGGALARVQACDEAVAIAKQTPEEIQGRAPAEVEKRLDQAAGRLDDVAEKAGEKTLREALEGLATAYRELEVADSARAGREVAATTAKYLQVIAAACVMD
ncbi:hypothetical protein [Spongiactinospora sp. 9N601]|uniref:hypothetical protein n=1 Tax=Spongiactinospora sp. 9N601 TaxID=3375149 RepID=UPI0037AD33C9